MHLLRTVVRNLSSLLLIARPITSCTGLNAKAQPSMSLAAKEAAKLCNSFTMAKRIVWVDLEMTGLDIEKDHILEIACLVTDANLNLVATGPDIIINHPDNVLDNMHEWSQAQHGESGLTEACRKSTISLQDAENKVLDFIKTHIPENKCPLAGNSVYMDRLFLRKYMPIVNEYLHYRIIDVSTIKELSRRWYQKEFSNLPRKKFKHRSMDDILDSIEELKYYRSNMFKQ